MAYERVSDNKIYGDSLDVFVTSRMKMFATQAAVRNAADEQNFSRAVLENNLSLEDQLAYRKEQLKRVTDDPEERKRIRSEVSSLTDRVEAKKFSDDYLAKLIEFESGMTSIDNMVSWLRARRDSSTDETIKSQIDQSLVAQEKNRFTLQKSVIENQTQYAVKDKTAEVLNAQIGRVQSARSQALLSGQAELVTTYDLQLQSLNQALNSGSIENDLKSFAASSLVGAQSALGLLDAYNSKIASALSVGSVTIGGTTYNSPQEFWRVKRDTYLADTSGNGFFGRLNDEKTAEIKVLNSQNLLSNNAVAERASALASLASRPELQAYTTQVNTLKQDVLQTGVDLRSKAVYQAYMSDYDINKAFNSLNVLKNLGANVDEVSTQILSTAAQIKQAQVGNILQVTQDLLKNNPGMTAEEALSKAVASGAGAVLSPTQLASKSEADIAKEQAAGAARESFQPDPRTTINNPTQTPPNTPPVVSGINDLSGKYGIVGSTVYRKSDNFAFPNRESFFADSGLNSFANLKFDTNYRPPVQAPTREQQQATAQNPVATPAPKPAGGVRPVAELVGTRGPNNQEYYRKDTNQGFAQAPDLFSYLKGQGYYISSFDELNPLLKSGK